MYNVGIDIVERLDKSIASDLIANCYYSDAYLAFLRLFLYYGYSIDWICFATED